MEFRRCALPIYCDAIALEAGLRREALADPNMPIEVATVPRFLDLASERLSCPSFSLRLGQRQNMLNLFGSLSLVIRSATTIDEFVRNLVDFFPLHTRGAIRSEEHTSELQSLMRISYAVFCLKKKNKHNIPPQTTTSHIFRT